MNEPEEKKANRLINEKSPYLLQHAYNPVDWYPWSEEAFEKAKKEDKPVFLSIGYSTCHWCHVMEKDSFEDREAAEVINKHFVPIKVDREERPDLDQKYMAACQALTGQGGWPLTVFLTPEKKPFYAATFIPKHSRYGIRGLMEILPRLSEYWKKDRDRVVKAGDDLTAALQQMTTSPEEAGSGLKRELPGEDLLEQSVAHLKDSYDSEYAGFGQAPKFPAPHQLIFLVRRFRRTGDQEALNMVVDTIRAMHRGGIFDQVGYGLHRYSVDEKWLVPHFEKMLYDQSLASLAALEAYRASGEEEMAVFTRKIFSYVLSELASPDGAFYAAEDADTEGREGTFYVWRPGELTEVLGEERGRLAAEYYGVTEAGNFEDGSSVLFRAQDDADVASRHGFTRQEFSGVLEEVRRKLYTARSRRERPFRDDKILASWNGMMIAALARGANILKEPAYLKAAIAAADFIEKEMVTPEGRLLRRYRDGEAAIPAFLDDYANMAWGYIEIYRAGNDQEYIEKAVRLSSEMLELFSAASGALRYSVLDDAPEDFGVEADAYDGATPSGLSVAAMNLLQLGRMQQEDDMAEWGESLIAGQSEKLERYPTGFTYLLAALDYALNASGDPASCTLDGDCGWE